MTQPTAAPSPRQIKPPVARRRRVKRGVVAGYLHDLSPRHRPDETTAMRRPKAPARD